MTTSTNDGFEEDGVVADDEEEEEGGVWTGACGGTEISDKSSSASLDGKSPSITKIVYPGGQT